MRKRQIVLILVVVEDVLVQISGEEETSDGVS